MVVLVQLDKVGAQAGVLPFWGGVLVRAAKLAHAALGEICSFVRTPAPTHR